MRDYRGRSGMTLRSHRRVSRARVFGVGLLIVALVVATLIWRPHSGPGTGKPADDQQIAQSNAKGAIPLKIPGQIQRSEAADRGQ